MFTRFQDDVDFDDLPEPEDKWGQREMALWAFRAVRILKKKNAKLEEALRELRASSGVTEASVPRATPMDALVARVGEAEAKSIAARIGYAEKFTSSTLKKLNEMLDLLGQLPSDAELKPFLAKLNYGRMYGNMDMQTLWGCDAAHMACYRYLLNKRGALEFVKNQGWKKLKDNISPI